MDWLWENGATALLLTGLALGLSILLRRFFRYQKRLRRENAAASRPGRSKPPERPPRGLVDAPADVVRWQVELHELARDAKAEIDSKIRILQALNRQAEEQASELRRLVERAEALQSPHERPQANRSSPEGDEPPAASPSSHQLNDRSTENTD